MKKNAIVLLVVSILVGSCQVCYATEETPAVDNAAIENADNTSVISEEESADDDKEISGEDEGSYIIQGFGLGITSDTKESHNDEYGELNSGISTGSISDEHATLIRTYYEKHKGGELFGNALNEGYDTNTGVGYIDYEYATIFSSQYGTYVVKTWMLNVYISSGGIDTIGAPVGEEYVEDGFIWQDFEKGTLSCEKESGQSDTLCVRRGNTYYFKCSIEGGEADYTVTYGKTTDDALIGDWDGDGIDTLCVRRGNLYYFKNNFSGGEADYVVSYGRSNDSTYVGDWDGDGIDTLCVRRGNSYYFQNDFSGGEADYVVSYGKTTDDTYVGDWDGDGIDTLCVRRGNSYYFQNNFNGGEADYVVSYGKSTDSTYVGDWDGDGVDTLCVRRGNSYYFQNNFSGGEADYVVNYGKATDSVYVGRWEKKVERLNECKSSQMLLNMSEGYSYSGLSLAFAGNAVNSTSFRKSALTTHISTNGDEIQYCAYYDYYGTVVLARRVNSGDWTYRWTCLKGTITDAHNVISIAVDGQGYLHVALSTHSGELTYARSTEPDSLVMEECIMLGDLEDKITYPEFYVLPSGDIFFLYRNGSSGNGNLVLNKYYTNTGEWVRVNENLISGEGERSPYWQAAIDSEGRLHISWVWRETTDASTNYNLSYMVSTDDSGISFTNSKGEVLQSPVTEETAEVIQEIPQNSALINQTSMTVDDDDCPYIISYWREDGIVQYQVIRYTGEQWIVYNTNIRTTDFSLGGTGTVQLPCARPQILVDGSGEDADIYVIFRDEERGSYASIATLSVNGTEITTESIIDITNSSLEEWEPNYDIELWRLKRQISIFMQKEYYTSDGSQERYRMEKVYVIDVPLGTE